MFRLDPPKKPPVITGFTSGNIISHDTQLRCKVSGGKPVVSKVIFTCERLPRPYTCEPTNGSDRTESALVVNHAPPSDTNNSVLCTCRAVWEPREDMYTQTSQMLLQICKYWFYAHDHNICVSQIRFSSRYCFHF